MNWLWYHYVAGFAIFACAAGVSVVGCMVARDACKRLFTRRRAEQRFQHVVMHALRDGR